jgi:hypothetical protein
MRPTPVTVYEQVSVYVWVCVSHLWTWQCWQVRPHFWGSLLNQTTWSSHYRYFYLSMRTLRWIMKVHPRPHRRPSFPTETELHVGRRKSPCLCQIHLPTDYKIPSEHTPPSSRSCKQWASSHWVTWPALSMRNLPWGCLRKAPVLLSSESL